MNQQFYVGFGTLEALLNSHAPASPIYLEALSETHGGGPLQFSDHYVIVSDVQDGVCRYWRKRLARTELIAGAPFHPADANRNGRNAESCRAAVEKVIREVHKFSVHAATIAMPRDLRLMDGEADCLKFDREQRAYVPA